MYRKVRFSDLTGKQLEENEGALVRIWLDTHPKKTLTLDVSADEIQELIEHARVNPRRGRPRKVPA